MIRRILRAPVDGRTWREFGYVLASLLPAVPAFALALLGAVASVLSLLTVGLPLLVVVLLLARVANRAFRWPARIVGWHWPLPPPVRRDHGRLRWARAVLLDGAGWRALLYCFVTLPVTALAAYIAAVSLAVGLAFLTSPVWWWLTPTGFGEIDDPGWAGTWLYVLQAVGVLLVWPWFLRLLVSLDRVMVRALLEPSPDRTRIAELQTSRALLAADAATVLSRLERDLHDGTQARLVSLGVTLGRIRHRVTDPEVRALVAGAQAQAAAAAPLTTTTTVYRPVGATWFGPGFYGKHTACGQVMTHALLGVAHRTLRCGTPVAVFLNGRTVTVPVVDRGPFGNGARYDLTSAAAESIGMEQSTKIGVVPIRGAQPAVPTPAPSPWGATGGVPPTP